MLADKWGVEVHRAQEGGHLPAAPDQEVAPRSGDPAAGRLVGQAGAVRCMSTMQTEFEGSAPDIHAWTGAPGAWRDILNCASIEKLLESYIKFNIDLLGYQGS